MQIQPYLGKDEDKSKWEAITASSVRVLVSPNDRTRALALVETTGAIASVKDETEFTAARNAAANLKAMLDEIEADREAAKKPWTAVGRGIDNLAADIAEPVKTEHKRVLGLLSGYVAKLQAAREAEERKQAEARRIAQAEADRKVREAEAARDRAQRELQVAQNEIERARRREEAQKRENQLLQEQLARELAADVEELGAPQEAPRGLVPGGRVNTDYEFKLVNVQATCEARCYRLLRWELDLQACKDSVKNQIELAPNVEPTLPGITITKKINVSVKAASRIAS